MTQTPVTPFPAAKPKKAFVPAAGEGTRMRPLTNNCPKPLLNVGGRTMLDRALDALAAAGVEDVVVNTCYLGHMIVEHLKTRTHPRITLSHEDALLDTGGGVKKMLEFFGDEPFYVLNADVLWTDGGGTPTLDRMAQHWDGSKMDVMLLVHDLNDTPDYMGRGDYHLPDKFGRPVFAKKDSGVAPNVVFAGPRIVHPRIFDGAPDGKFSFLQLFHKAEETARLFALLHDGAWYHVGTPEAMEKTNKILGTPPASPPLDRKQAP